MKKKIKIIRIVVGIVAALVWYICSTKGGDAVVQEVAGLLAVLCLFGKLIWRFLFHSRTDEKASAPNAATTTQVSPSRKKTKITIAPYHPDFNKTWEWDGKLLCPYHPDFNKTWEFDGKQLRPFHPDFNKTWEWDGKQLRPFHLDYDKTWEWDGKQLRPFHPDFDKTWEFDGKQLRPFHPDFNKTWEVSRDVPIPVLAKAVGII